MKKVCIIDSGYSNDSNIRIDQIERSLTIRYYNNTFHVDDGAEDKIGHGTAILSILQHGSSPDIKYYIVKIFDDELTCDAQVLVYALNYIYDNIKCDLINLSLGITGYNHKRELFEVCDKLYKKGIVLVSAFDNDGSVSFPAAFPFVIGVDNNSICKNRDEIAFIEGSIVNVFAFGRMQRISCNHERFMYLEGSSMACAHITRLLSNTDSKSFEEAVEELKNRAQYCFYKDGRSPNFIKPSTISNSIKKAVLFPYNKEMHSVVKFDKLLPFSIAGVYDSPKSGHVGRKIESLDGYYVIRNFNDIDWESDFDTVVLGHLGELSALTNEHWFYTIMSLCERYKKRVYCFDVSPSVPDAFKSVPIEWPDTDFISDKFGKLYDIDCPVLAVMGTGPKQGKYTLQLILRSLFTEHGYKIGQLGSEPSSLLFGMDEVFHFGYNSKFDLSDIDFIEALNSSLNRIQEKDVDIIIAGCQSGTIPYSFVNTKYATNKQISFLSGVNPDRVVLCVNVFDDLSYIGRTISFIEALVSCHVIAIVLFPMNYIGSHAFGNAPSRRENDEVLSLKKKEISQKFNLPCFELGIKNEMLSLYTTIIESFR